MASGTLRAEETREKHRWNENSKVYTRKIHKSKTTQNTVQVRNTDTNNEKSATDSTAATTTAINDEKAATTAATIIATKSKTTQNTVQVRNTDTNNEKSASDSTAATTTAINDEKAATTAATITVTKSKTTHDTVQVRNTDTNNEKSATDSTAATTTAINDEKAASTAATTTATDDEKVAAAAATRTATADDKTAITAATTTANDELNAIQSTRLNVSNVDGSHDAAMPNNDNVITREDRTSNGDSVPAKERSKDASPSAPAPASPGLQPAEDANYQQHQTNLLRTEAVVSEDSSTLNQQRATVTNANADGNVAANGSLSVRQAMTGVDDKVNISFSAVRTKKEAKDLKRKLANDLEDVRNLWRKLEDKEAQISGVVNSTDPGAVGVGGGGQSRSQYSTNGGTGIGGCALRVNSEAGSVGLNESRPFRSLSVSLMTSSHGTGENMEKEKRTPKANQLYRSSDFIYGKDKFPPAESNKKHKSISKKHGGGIGGFIIDKQVFKKCCSLLQRLMKHKHGWVFNDPVDVRGLGLHDYYDIIKHPMDLGTVKNRLNKNWYKSPLEFAEDVRLTFRNARTYNPEGQDVHVMAVELSNIFEERWAEIEAEYNRRLRYEMSYNMGYPTPRRAPVLSYVTPPLPYIPAPSLPLPHTPLEYRRLDRSESINLPVESRVKPVVYHTPSARTPVPKKPKAKDPHKRDMTFEEKQRLSTNLQALPSEKLDNIVQIIKRRNSAVSQHNDEIEVDIDSVDAETLWELDRFVTNYKKSLSKHKRKAELALQAKAAAEQAAQQMQQTVPAPPSVEVPKEIGTDETNGAASSPVQGEKQTDNASGSSSSSSSSSDSDSSSSDSDSDSSSGTGSDGGH